MGVMSLGFDVWVVCEIGVWCDWCSVIGVMALESGGCNWFVLIGLG